MDSKIFRGRHIVLRVKSDDIGQNVFPSGYTFEHCNDTSSAKVEQSVFYEIEGNCLKHTKEIEIDGEDYWTPVTEEASNMAYWDAWPDTKERVLLEIDALIADRQAEIDAALELKKQLSAITEVQEFKTKPTPEDIKKYCGGDENDDDDDEEIEDDIDDDIECHDDYS